VFNQSHGFDVLIYFASNHNVVPVQFATVEERRWRNSLRSNHQCQPWSHLADSDRRPRIPGLGAGNNQSRGSCRSRKEDQDFHKTQSKSRF